MIAYAGEGPHTEAAKGLLAKLEGAIIFPLMTLMMSVALLMFLWGAYQFVANAENDEARRTGRVAMLFGIIGMLVMLSALAIIKIATGTFGITIGG